MAEKGAQVGTLEGDGGGRHLDPAESYGNFVSKKVDMRWRMKLTHLAKRVSDIGKTHLFLQPRIIFLSPSTSPY